MIKKTYLQIKSTVMSKNEHIEEVSFHSTVESKDVTYGEENINKTSLFVGTFKRVANRVKIRGMG